MTEWYTKKMILEQRYQELITCRDLWIQYRNALEIYPDILKIRKKYHEYKEANIVIASCKEIVYLLVYISVIAVSLKKKN